MEELNLIKKLVSIMCDVRDSSKIMECFSDTELIKLIDIFENKLPFDYSMVFCKVNDEKLCSHLIKYSLDEDYVLNYQSFENFPQWKKKYRQNLCTI